jgi:hypothetical protein
MLMHAQRTYKSLNEKTKNKRAHIYNPKKIINTHLTKLYVLLYNKILTHLIVRARSLTRLHENSFNNTYSMV